MKSLKSVICLILMAVTHAFSQTKPESNSFAKQAVISESGATIQINANSPRPLGQTLDALLQKYKWVVNYEDPQYISKSDVVEGPEGGELPAGGRFSVEIPSAQEKEKNLQLVVDSYNRSDNPGRFELRKSPDGVFFVVGVQARDAHGKMAPQKAPFDLPLTIVTKQRTVAETLDLICKKIALQSRIPVTIGVSPRNVLGHNNVTVGGARVSARDLLLRTLDATHRSLYWRLLFDPKSKSYFLDIHLVPKS